MSVRPISGGIFLVINFVASGVLNLGRHHRDSNANMLSDRTKASLTFFVIADLNLGFVIHPVMIHPELVAELPLWKRKQNPGVKNLGD